MSSSWLAWSTMPSAYRELLKAMKSDSTHWSTLVPYGKRPYPSFASDMDKDWAFLLSGNIAPVWVGEFGAPHHEGDRDRHYWDNLMRFLNETDADYGYWALNPRKPEGYDNETYGLLRDDWETPVDDYRLADLKKLMKSREERAARFTVQQ